jgi:AmmeMemoRadiSam system protein B
MGTAYMRYPRVAGTFYPKQPAEMAALLDKCFAQADQALLPPGRAPALGAMIPHAGWVYSGGVAAKVYARLAIPETVVVLGPNHTGMGAALSLWPGGLWITPGGDVHVDEALTGAILEACPDVESETLAHANEHAIEVHVPFIHRERRDAKIVAIVVGTHDAARLNRLAEGLARAIKAAGRSILIVSSSDMNHYEDQATTLAKDKLALDRVVNLDATGLLEVCHNRDISMCGVAPTAVMLRACQVLGARTAQLVDHRTSGDAFGDYSRVVGYAGAIVR